MFIFNLKVDILALTSLKIPLSVSLKRLKTKISFQMVKCDSPSSILSQLRFAMNLMDQNSIPLKTLVLITYFKKKYTTSNDLCIITQQPGASLPINLGN